ncbi:MAG TPA: hypothetical protein VN780_12705 [Candidatus Eisenbacteria bacterium]|jgi:hypothetical protein|nr:hypothetical protein [Candidatus Eisenbacteria bacterium]
MAMQAPARKLTTHQQAVLIQVLLAFPEQRVAIQTSPSAGDAAAYAQNFLAIFKACGWNVDPDAQGTVSGVETPGLAIVVQEDHHLPASAEALRDALRIYQMEVGTVCEPASTIDPGAFVLRIGAQPQ